MRRHFAAALRGPGRGCTSVSACTRYGSAAHKWSLSPAEARRPGRRTGQSRPRSRATRVQEPPARRRSWPWHRAVVEHLDRPLERGIVGEYELPRDGRSGVALLTGLKDPSGPQRGCSRGLRSRRPGARRCSSWPRRARCRWRGRSCSPPRRALGSNRSRRSRHRSRRRRNIPCTPGTAPRRNRRSRSSGRGSARRRPRNGWSRNRCRPGSRSHRCCSSRRTRTSPSSAGCPCPRPWTGSWTPRPARCWGSRCPRLHCHTRSSRAERARGSTRQRDGRKGIEG